MIVITTPTGQIGRQVLGQLLESSEALRVIVRDPAHLDPAVRERAEVVTGSHADPAVVTEAFAGADCVFWVVPPNPQAAQPEAYYRDFTRAACAALISQGVRRVVAVSSLGRTFAQDAGLLTAAFAMDTLIEQTGVSYRALRAPFILENLLHQVPAIASHGTLSLPNAAERPLRTVATADLAAAAVQLLLDGSWRGQDSLPVIGPDRLSPTEMARVMAKVLGRPVHFQHVGAAYSLSLTQSGAAEGWAQGLLRMAAAQDQGMYESDPGAGAPHAPTDFQTWCGEVLKPAVQASRAAEIRKGFAHLHAADPVLAALIDKRPNYEADAWRRELPEMDLFGCLLAQIIGQQISLKAAQAILGRLSAKFDGQVPRAEQAATLSEQELRDVGLTWRKAKTVLDLAARFTDGRLSEQRLRSLPDDQIMAELIQVSGIGPWTVHGALLIYLHRGDVVPVGDILLKNTIRTSYGLDHVPTEQEVTDIAAAWRPYGSLGVNLLFAAAELD
jgi:3-methyladenine DNA glycosylase/8-oxoguanine DNA glycosylase/uncharacterized protein YbjT (DUF2867 family)